MHFTQYANASFGYLPCKLEVSFFIFHTGCPRGRKELPVMHFYFREVDFSWLYVQGIIYTLYYSALVSFFIIFRRSNSLQDWCFYDFKWSFGSWLRNEKYSTITHPNIPEKRYYDLWKFILFSFYLVAGFDRCRKITYKRRIVFNQLKAVTDW